MNDDQYSLCFKIQSTQLRITSVSLCGPIIHFELYSFSIESTRNCFAVIFAILCCRLNKIWFFTFSIRVFPRPINNFNNQLSIYSILSFQSLINIVRKGNCNMVYIKQIGVHTTAVINLNGRFLISNSKNSRLYNAYNI